MAEAASRGGDDATPVASHDEVMDALERILDSRAFSQTPRSRDFLAFVVTETLAGRGDRLKERTVARRALGRGDAFDSKEDAGVRVQAGRVRAALDQYYHDEGRDDRVRITLPKGSYVPTFVEAPADRDTAPRRRTLGPGVGIVQFTTTQESPSSTAMAMGLTESLVAELSRYPGIRVLGPLVRSDVNPDAADERRLGARLDVQYVLRGTVDSTDEMIRVTIGLADAATGELVWSDAFDCPVEACSGFAGRDDLVRRIAGFLGDYSGVVLRNAAATPPASAHPVVWKAMLLYYEGLNLNTAEAGAAAQAALRDAVAIEPDDPTLLAMLASTEAYAALLSTGVAAQEAAERAEAYARQALALDSRSWHAHISLANAALTRGQVQASRQELDAALAIAPDNPTVLYGAGWLLALSGEWERGVAYVQRSTELNPTHPVNRYLMLSIDRLLAGAPADALVYATRYVGIPDFWGALLRALSLHALGHDAEAWADLRSVQRHFPDFREEVATEPGFPSRVRRALVDRIDALLRAPDVAL